MRQRQSGTQKSQNNKRLEYAGVALHKIKNAKWQTNLHIGDADFLKSFSNWLVEYILTGTFI